MKNRQSLSTLALVAMVFVALACGCPKNLNLNNSNSTNNSNNSNSSNNSHGENSNNRNSPVNANRPPDRGGFIKQFSVSSNPTGNPSNASFATSDRIFLVFGFDDMPDAKGLKGKLIAVRVPGVAAGTSLETIKNTHPGESMPQFQFYFFPKPAWTAGIYRVELLLMDNDGTEDVLKSQEITIR
jgi:hypothetical protein